VVWVISVPSLRLVVHVSGIPSIGGEVDNGLICVQNTVNVV